MTGMAGVPVMRREGRREKRGEGTV